MVKNGCKLIISNLNPSKMAKSGHKWLLIGPEWLKWWKIIKIVENRSKIGQK
jgi:hypothetical protein